MIVISDTSPISALFRIGKLDLLETLFGQVILPKMVWNELQQLAWGYDSSQIAQLSWVIIQSASPCNFLSHLQLNLDPGEAEAIALAKELNADLLLIDELKGRKLALTEGLQVVGLLGVLLRAKQQGLLPSLRLTIEELIQTTKFRASRKIINEVLALAGE